MQNELEDHKPHIHNSIISLATNFNRVLSSATRVFGRRHTCANNNGVIIHQ